MMKKQRMLSIRVIFALAMFPALMACQLAPTKSSSRESRDVLLIESLQEPLQITEKTVVLDARSSFEYGLNRVANSLHFPWESLAESFETGELLRDSRKATMKLSLLGIEPSTHVIVLGAGPNGGGEEGRVAWSLKYFGVENVQVASLEVFRKLWTQRETPQPSNVTTWVKKPRLDWVIGKQEFLKLAKDPKGRIAQRIHIIDVRSEVEYFNKADRKMKSPPIDLNTLHIEWREFFTAQGRPNPALRRKLESINVQSGDRIIVVSDRGVRSAAVAYALMALGYKQVQNFGLGWRSLSSRS